MKKILLLLTCSLSAHLLYAQDVFDWKPGYKLSLADFQSPTTAIGGPLNSLHTATAVSFSFHMSNYEFLFTKNFNSKVSCTFNKKASSLIAPDDTSGERLLRFAQYEFDLSELYARKFRKELYEQKGAFSSASFFQPVFDKLQAEMSERHTSAAGETDLGRKVHTLEQLHADVLQEIAALSDFCKECKPAKKKKR